MLIANAIHSAWAHGRMGAWAHGRMGAWAHGRMGKRAALLICCSRQEAAKMRECARIEHRNLSSYILSVLLLSIDFEEALYSRYQRLTDLLTLRTRKIRDASARTTVLLRCSQEEAKRIRVAAQRRDATISGFTLYILQRSWDLAERRRAAHVTNATGANPKPAGQKLKPQSALQ
jgi:uncharacterized protein (DUF1778 family)